MTAAKGGATLGTAPFSIEPGTTTKVTVKLSKAARSQLAKKRKLKALASTGGKPVKLKLIAAKPKRG